MFVPPRARCLPARLAVALAVALGALAAAAAPPAAADPAPAVAGPVPAYWLTGADGSVYGFGGVPLAGSMAGQHLNAPIVGMAADPATGGYWLVASDGGVFAFNAPFYGSMGGSHLNQPIVAMAEDPATGGYWLVASDGGIFAFNAPFYGSMGGSHLNQPIVGMAADAATGGYWMVASDGGIFAYDAPFVGSMGGATLNKPVVSMAPDASGTGYWLVASDGGVFNFNAPFYGSLGADPLTRPVVAITAAGAGGYWMTDSGGAVTAFGAADYWGSTPQSIPAPVVAMVGGAGTGAMTNDVYPSGSYGYDLSKYEDNPPACDSTLPSGHTVGVVEVDGWGDSAANPCLAHEAAWAGAGLNLYTFLTYGTAASGPASCGGDQACNFGYLSGVHAYDDATAAGVDPMVPWWVDVEPSDWSGNVAENAQVVQGALRALRDLGINNVGVYTSPLTWNGLVGDYQPAVPVWIAWYTGDPQANCANARSYAAANGNQLPTGPILLTQYTDNGGTLDGDYAC